MFEKCQFETRAHFYSITSAARAGRGCGAETKHPSQKTVTLKQNLMVLGELRNPNQDHAGRSRETRERVSICEGRQEFSMASKIRSSLICRPHDSVLSHAGKPRLAGTDTNPITAARRRHKSKGPFDDRSV